MFPEEIIIKETGFMVAMHFTFTAATAADWIDFGVHRRKVMTGQHKTRMHLFAGRMAKHFYQTLLFTLSLSEKRCAVKIKINMWCCALMVVHEMATVFSNGLKDSTVRILSCAVISKGH